MNSILIPKVTVPTYTCGVNLSSNRIVNFYLVSIFIILLRRGVLEIKAGGEHHTEKIKEKHTNLIVILMMVSMYI